MVTLYVAACLRLGWDRPAGTVALVCIYVFAGLASFLYLASQWLGVSARPPTGFRIGRVTYLSPRETKVPSGLAVKVERFCNWIPWQLREPFFHLPVLLPVVWAAATFASVDHRVAGDIYGPLEPTLIALLAAVIAINGFLAIRGRHTIDFLGALATVLVLIAGTTISLVQIASGSNNEIQWVAAALVFGVVAIVQTGIHGADSPDGGEPDTETQSPQANDPVPEKVPNTGTVETNPPPAESCHKQPHCCHKQPHCHSPTPQRQVNLLAAAGALAALVIVVSALWLAPLVIEGAVLGAGGLHLAALICVLATAGFLLLAIDNSEKRQTWLLATVVGAVLAAVLSLGGSLVQKHWEGAAGADCLAFDTQFAQLVGEQSQTTALQLSKSDQRRRACMPALKHLKWSTTKPDCLAFDVEFEQLVRGESLAFALRAMQYDGRRTACEPSLGRIERYPQITDCVAFLAEIDQLVDDEPIKVATAAIAHDPRTRICHPHLGLLARR